MTGNIQDLTPFQDTTFKNTPPEILRKRLRFHPTYYQSRKGSFFTGTDEERRSVKVQSLDKTSEGVEIRLADKKSGEQIEITSEWRSLEFDYYVIQNESEGWMLKLSRR